jgi:lipoate-protein ligase B
LSVNVSLDLKYFSLIRFCGLQDAKAASLEEILGRPVSIAEAKKVFSDSFKKIFSDKASDVSAIFSLVG